LDYEHAVDQVSAKAVQRLVRLYPAGRWVPVAALEAVWGAIHSKSKAVGSLDGLLRTMRDFGIISMTRHLIFRSGGAS
jgi:hypothetical protein